MSEGAAARIPTYVRFTTYAILVALFVLPCVVGRIDTYLILIGLLVAIVTPSVLVARRLASRNVIDLVYVGVFLALAVSFAVTAEDGRDLLFIFNFSPFLLAVPFRWQLERLARGNGVLIVGWLALAGTVGAAGLAAIQVFVLGYVRVGQPIMSVFHYADTTMLLGFLALAGCFAPGTHSRLPFVAGPFIAVAAVVVSNTRGALIAAPALLLLAFSFAFFTSRNKWSTLAVAGTAVALLAAGLALAPMLGFGRAIEGFDVVSKVLGGGQVDSPTQERLTMLTGGLQAFLHAPIFGYGWLDMVPAIFPYVPASEVKTMEGFRHLHNGAMSFAVGAGSIGLLSFILLSVIPVIAVLRTPRDSQFVGRMYLAATLCVGFLMFQLTFLLIGFEFHTVQYALMAMVFVSFARDPVPAYSAEGNAVVGSETAKTA